VTARSGYLEPDEVWDYQPTAAVSPSVLTVPRSRPLTLGELAAVRRVVAGFAVDAADCRVLLEALGVGRVVAVDVAPGRAS
jgi:hypothetical protein